jgi:AcrR family transcriptional regulator
VSTRPAKTARKKPTASATSLRGGVPAQERELRAQGRKTMRKLLDAGMTVFERRGYHAARVDDIVKVAKTSHGTFYLYFSNKEDLFRALALDVSEAMTELAESLGPITQEPEGYAEIRAWLERFFEMYSHYGPVIRAWTEAEIVENDLGRLGAQVLASFARALGDRIAESGNADVDPQIAALAFISMIERFNYLVLSRQIAFDRGDMLDTLAAITHAGLFHGRALHSERVAKRA